MCTGHACSLSVGHTVKSSIFLNTFCLAGSMLYLQTKSNPNFSHLPSGSQEAWGAVSNSKTPVVSQYEEAESNVGLQSAVAQVSSVGGR